MNALPDLDTAITTYHVAVAEAVEVAAQVASAESVVQAIRDERWEFLRDPEVPEVMHGLYEEVFEDRIRTAQKAVAKVRHATRERGRVYAAMITLAAIEYARLKAAAITAGTTWFTSVSRLRYAREAVFELPRKGVTDPHELIKAVEPAVVAWDAGLIARLDGWVPEISASVDAPTEIIDKYGTYDREYDLIGVSMSTREWLAVHRDQIEELIVHWYVEPSVALDIESVVRDVFELRDFDHDMTDVLEANVIGEGVLV